MRMGSICASVAGNPCNTQYDFLIIIDYYHFFSGISRGPCNNIVDDDDGDDYTALLHRSRHLWVESS